MASTRSSDYVAIGSGGNGIGGRSGSSRRLERGPQPGGEEEDNNDSTPVVVDDNDGDGGKVEVNGECKGDSNSDGPIDNNNDNNDYIDNNDDNKDGGGRTEAQMWDNC